MKPPLAVNVFIKAFLIVFYCISRIEIQLGFGPSNFLCAQLNSSSIALLCCLPILPDFINSFSSQAPEKSSVSQAGLLPQQQNCRHVGTACPSAFLFLKKVHPSWSPSSFWTTSQGILPARPLSGPKPTLWKSTVAVLLIASLIHQSYPARVTAPKVASNHHISLHLVLVKHVSITRLQNAFFICSQNKCNRRKSKRNFPVGLCQ